MAVIELTVTPVVTTGVAGALAAANADGYTVVNAASRMWIEVLNEDASPINVTIATTGTVDGNLAVDNRIVAVPAGARRLIGGFARSDYGNPVTVTFSAVTDVTVAAFSV